MARACTICTHAKRATIDAAMLAGAGSNRAIARQFAVSRDSLDRHRAHIAQKVEKARAEEGRTLASIIAEAHADLTEAIGWAKDDKDGNVLVKAVQARAKLAEVEFGTKRKVDVTMHEAPATPSEELAQLRDLRAQVDARLAELEREGKVMQ